MNKVLRILHIDDNLHDRQLVRDALEKEIERFEIIEADSRIRFEELLAEFNFDLVLSDFNILGFDGLQVLQIVKERNPEIPVIIVTGTGSEEIAVQAMKSGADDYVIKSAKHIQNLFPTIKLVLEKKRIHREYLQTLDALKESEERFRLLFTNSLDAVLLTVPNGEILQANKAACRIFGKTEDELKKGGRYGIIDKSDPRLEKALEERMVSGKFNGELTGLRNDGTPFPIEISSSLYFDSHGNQRSSMIIKDISERKKAELAFIASEEKYRTIFENVQDVFYQTDLTGIIHEISPSIKYFSEFQREDLIGENVTKLYADIDQRDTLLRTLREKKEVRDFEIKIKTKDDEIRYASINARLITNSRGEPDHIDGALRDITRRVKVEDDLRHSEEKFRSIFENHSAVKLIIDPDTGRIVDANRAASLFYGWSVEQLKQMLIGEINASSNIKAETESARDKDNMHFEFQHRCKDGSVKDVEVFSSKVIISGKEFLHSIVHDVSAKKKAEEQIRLLSKSIEQSPVSVVITDPKGIIEYVNPAFSLVTGYSAEEAIGKNPNILQSGEHSKEFYMELWNTVLAGNEWTGEFHNKKKNGELIWEKASISPLLDETGQITHFVGIKEDVTDKRKMLQDLITAKENAEAGDRLKSAFINNISHEIRTPLNGIVGFSELLANPEISNENRILYKDIIKKSSVRLLNTITSFMDISMIVSGNMQVYNKQFLLYPLMEDLKQEFEEACLSKNILLDLQVPANSSEITLYTDSDMLNKILFHLIDNAVKFTSSGKIEFGFKMLGDQIEFFVTDTGIGIDPDKIRIIFDYFRQADISHTRGYEGSGLGLSISLGLVKLLKGELFVDSEINKGTTFRFRLDNEIVTSVENESMIAGNQPQALINPIILIAEDDEVNYKYLEILLKKAKYNVLWAKNGLEAIEMCRLHPNIALILMDMKMPVISGMEATRKIKNFRPEMKVIALTAYLSTADELDALANGCDRFLSKPVNGQKLLGLIAQFLGN